MQFWLDVDEDQGAGGGFTQPQSLSFASPTTSPHPSHQKPQNPFLANQTTTAFVCEVCGHDETELDETTGRQVCTNCFTQSQVLTQDMTELDMEEVMGLAAKSKVGGRVLNARTSLGGGAAQNGGSRLKGRARQDLEELNQAKPLPSLTLCLKGLQCILHRSTACVAKCMQRDLPHLVHPSSTYELQENLLEIVKHVWFAYLRSWHLGAQYYGTKNPTLRLSFRDFFLPNQYKSMLPKIIAHGILTQNDKQANDASPSPTTTPRDNGKTRVSWQGVADDPIPNQKTAHDATIPQPSNPSGRRERRFGFDELLHQLIIYHTYVQTKGCREAALLLKPTLAIVVTILHVATLRAGLAPHYLLTWIREGDWPLWDAFESHLLSSDLRESLDLVQSFYRLASWPSMAQLEQDAQLLLIAAGLESEASWRELVGGSTRGSLDKTISRDMPGLIPVTSVPSLLAQSVADLGLGAEVLQCCLGLVGLYKGQGKAGVLIPAAQVTKMSQILALIVCATVLVQNPSGRVLHRGDGTPIPWNEFDFARMRQGSVKAYAEFYSSFSFSGKSAVPEFTELLQKQEQALQPKSSVVVESDEEDSDSDTSIDSSAPHKAMKNQVDCRSCGVVNCGAPGWRDVEFFPLRRLVYRALRNNAAKEWPSLLPAENLLIDFVAFAHFVLPTDVVRALEGLLLHSGTDKRKREPEATADPESDTETRAEKRNEHDDMDDNAYDFSGNILSSHIVAI